MNTYLIAYHSDFDGNGKSIRMIQITAPNNDEAILTMLRGEGWECDTMKETENIFDVSWSDPIFLREEK